MRRRDLTRLAAVALGIGGVALAIGSSSCLQIAGFDDFSFSDTSPAPLEPVFAPLRDQRPRKMDILLVLDESGSGASALELLTDSLRSLFGEVLNPPCVDAKGTRTPVGPTDRCPGDSVRASAVVPDVHIGIVTTSMGSYGIGEVCAPESNRLGHLYFGAQPTWNDTGVFVFDLAQTHVPPGSADPDALAAALEGTVGELVSAKGCGLEQQMEAWYHFLADPEPHVVGGIEPGPIDETLLAQRSAFLRDDSVVVVLMLSDEDDFSMEPIPAAAIIEPSKVGAAENPTTACADPDDPCCAPCFDGICAGPSCSDPACEGIDCQGGYLVHQSINILSWETKRRYGIDPFRPVTRYIDALSSPTLETDDGEVMPNPLLAGRRAKDVYFAAVVGVPWQDVARVNAQGEPDLVAGLDGTGTARGGLRSASELGDADIWPQLLGSPPLDPHMITTPEIRPGLAGVDSAALEDPKHGHEYETAYQGYQYTCLGALPAPGPCGEGYACDCSEVIESPECQDPESNQYVLDTRFRKLARPGSRFLEVARALGDQAIVGSICAAQADDAESLDYGFSAAIVGGISDKLKPRLATPSCGPRVAAEPLDACRIVEASVAPLGGCDCPAPGRAKLTQADDALLARVQGDPTYVEAGWSCVCEIVRADDLDLGPCREQPEDTVISGPGYLSHGWCNLPPDSPVAAAFSDACAADETAYRLIGDARPLPGAGLFIDCR